MMIIKPFTAVTLLLVSASLAWAGDIDSTLTSNSTERLSQRMEYHDIYSKVPSLLSQWDYSDFSYISLGSTLNQGDFRNPQLFKKHTFLEIKTESILTLPKNNWRFFGEFGYKNGSSEGGAHNLSYQLPTNGSPYYFMQTKEGEWDFQTYEFSTGMAKTFKNKRISAGVGINYIGDLAFRTIDSRNENYKLNFGITPSATFKINDSQSVSFGVKWDHTKTEPHIYDKYQHGTEIENYQVYFNEGLGTRYRNPERFYMTDNQFGAIFSWTNKTQKGNTNLVYRISKGTEEWKLKYYSAQALSSGNISKYNLFNNDLDISHYQRLNSGLLHASLNVNLMLGNGFLFSSAPGVYQKNYTSTIGNSNLLVDYSPKRGVIQQVGLSSEFGILDQTEINYSHNLQYSNLSSRGWVDFFFGNPKSKNLLLELNGGYRLNLNMVDTPKAAASTFFTTDVLLPTLAYISCDYYFVGGKIATEFDIRKYYRMEIKLSGEYIRPTTINYAITQATFTTNDQYLNLSLKVLFNF